MITFGVLPFLPDFCSFPKPSVVVSIPLLHWMVKSALFPTESPFVSAIYLVVVVFLLVLWVLPQAKKNKDKYTPCVCYTICLYRVNDL